MSHVEHFKWIGKHWIAMKRQIAAYPYNGKSSQQQAFFRSFPSRDVLETSRFSLERFTAPGGCTFSSKPIPAFPDSIFPDVTTLGGVSSSYDFSSVLCIGINPREVSLSLSGWITETRPIPFLSVVKYASRRRRLRSFQRMCSHVNTYIYFKATFPFQLKNYWIKKNILVLHLINEIVCIKITWINGASLLYCSWSTMQSNWFFFWMPVWRALFQISIDAVMYSQGLNP